MPDMRMFACLIALGTLGACAPTYDDTGFGAAPADIGTGVGFGGYDAYEAQRIARERELSGEGAAPVISSEELNAAGLPAGGSGAGGLPPAQPIGEGAPLSQAPVSPGGNSGISDEQSFAAVSARESIESDAARLQRQAQAYRVIQPTAVPTRRGSGGPNIVAYALDTTNEVGQPIYSRGGIALQSRSARACARYPSPDLAQEAFLERGGPERDRLNLDPDGDGFACAWNPAPFRAARG